MKRRSLALVLIGLLAFAACGDDDGAGVRSSGSASGSLSGSGSGSASGSGSLAAADEGEGKCEVVDGSDEEPTSEAHVTLDEWEVAVEEDALEAGVVLFEATNDGEDAHELVIVRGATDELPMADGVVDEEGLAEGDFIGEIEPFDGSCEGAFELTEGTYTVFCAIVEEEDDGTVENHFDLGMHTEVEVG